MPRVDTSTGIAIITHAVGLCSVEIRKSVLRLRLRAIGTINCLSDVHQKYAV